MNFVKRKSVYTELRNYCHHANPHEIAEVTEWINGEGWDIVIGSRQLQLTHGELQAILVLCNTPHSQD